MPQIILKKLITRKESLAVINNLVNTLGISIKIEDQEGHKLLGAESNILVDSYPIELSGETLGWVIGPEKATAVASLLSYLVKQELEKKGLANELLNKYQELELLEEISTQVTASLDLQKVAQLVIGEAGKLSKSTQGAILLLNQKTGYFETIAEFGQTYSYQDSLILGQGIIGTIVQTGRGEIVNDVSSDPRFTDTHEPIKSLICVPLKTKEQLLGVLTVSSQTAVTYTAEDLKLLNMLALQAAVAMEKALLYEQSRTTALVAQEQAQTLQRTLDQLQQTQAQLIQSEKMSGLGQLVAGIAHEINNPVNFIYGNLTHTAQYSQDLLQLLQLYTLHYPSPAPEIQSLSGVIDLNFLVEDFPRLLSSMKLGAERIRQIILSLRNFSRLDQAEMKPVDIHEGIDSTLLILQNQLKARGRHPGIQVVKEYGQLPPIECYASQLNQVFLNILTNAIDALESQKEPGIITIRTELVKSQKELNFNRLKVESCHLLIPSDTPVENSFSFGRQLSHLPPATLSDSVLIRISDNGSGITEAVRTQIFDPFFTTKPVGKGTGLGLSISYQIVVEKHGGILECFSQPSQGAEFWIQIPVVQTVGNSCCDILLH